MSARRLFAALAFLALGAAPLAASATITIVNANDPGIGFNDPTPAAPIGGNPGTTLGTQRLNAFQYAAQLWGTLVDSNVEISIKATFEPLDCSAGSGTLGAAGPTTAVLNFPNAPLPDTWYAVALANSIAGSDLEPSSDGHIVAKFNSNVGTSGCLATAQWYYGFDNNHGDAIDLVSVLLHEFAHGLGFLTFVDATTGTEFSGHPDVFEKHVVDTSTGQHWDEMAGDADRLASATRDGSIVWDGAAVTAAVPGTLVALPVLSITAPAAIAGDLAIGTADFGAALTVAGVSGSVAEAADAPDAAGPTTTDACSAVTNPADVFGKIALVDRGTCLFVDKARNVQAAGAIGVVVANNVADPSAVAMGGSDPTITIPAVSITQADGATIRANISQGVAVALRLNPDRHSGADAANHMLLYAPNPVESGSSISHWDTSAYPHLLMQPNLAGDLPHVVDLTLPLLGDIGWTLAATAPGTEPRERVHRVVPEEHPRAVRPRDP